MISTCPLEKVLHDTEFRESFRRAETGLDGLSHPLLSAHLFQRAFKHLRFRIPWDDTHPIQVAEYQVARPDKHVFDLNRNAKIDDFTARSLILCKASGGESREVQSKNARGVTGITIQHGACRAQPDSP